MLYMVQEPKTNYKGLNSRDIFFHLLKVEKQVDLLTFLNEKLLEIISVINI